MKYTLQDFPTSSYVFDVANATITLTVPFDFSSKSLYAVINTTRNRILYQVNEATGTTITGNIINISWVDMTDMSGTDELMIIFDAPTQATKVINEQWEDVTKQLEDLADSLLDISQRIAFLPAVRWTLNSIRSEIINTVPVTATNVTGIWGVNTINMIWIMQNNLVANAITSNLSFN